LHQGVGVRLGQFVIDVGRLAVAVVRDERQAGDAPGEVVACVS
jgi:hypothetical protein